MGPRILHAFAYAAVLATGIMLGRLTHTPSPQATPVVVPPGVSKDETSSRPPALPAAPLSPPREAATKTELEVSSPPGSFPLSKRKELKSFADVVAQLRLSANVEIISRSDRLNPDFSKILELEDSQREEINRALGETRKAMDALLLQHAVIGVTDYGGIRIKVNGLEDGPTLYDNLMDRVGSTLDRDRQDPLVSFLSDQFAAAFNNFGAQTRVIEIAHQVPGHVIGPDKSYYLIDTATLATGETDTLRYSFYGSRLEYLPNKVRWAAEAVGNQLDRTSLPPITPK